MPLLYWVLPHQFLVGRLQEEREVWGRSSEHFLRPSSSAPCLTGFAAIGGSGSNTLEQVIRPGRAPDSQPDGTGGDPLSACASTEWRHKPA